MQLMILLMFMTLYIQWLILPLLFLLEFFLRNLQQVIAVNFFLFILITLNLKMIYSLFLRLLSMRRFFLVNVLLIYSFQSQLFNNCAVFILIFTSKLVLSFYPYLNFFTLSKKFGFLTKSVVRKNLSLIFQLILKLLCFLKCNSLGNLSHLLKIFGNILKRFSLFLSLFAFYDNLK